MDLSAPPPAARKRRLSKKSRARQRRLQLRKTTVQAAAVQPRDKQAAQQIAGEWERSPARRTPQTPQTPLTPLDQQSPAHTLRFRCCQCRDDWEYEAQELERHCEDRHGSRPVFSCQTCSFSTDDFSFLQLHLLSHQDSVPSCSICNDGVQRSWSELSAHLTLSHCQDGKYLCDACPRFSSGDVMVFLEHLHKHSVGLEGGSQDPSLHRLHPAHTLLQHIKAMRVCPSADQKKQKPNEPIPKTKARLTRSAVRQMCWLTQDCLALPASDFLQRYCQLPHAHSTLQSRQFLTGDQKWTKALESVLSHVPKNPENGVVLDAPDLTVLTLENKITVAQNGFSKKLKVVRASEREAVMEAQSGAAPPQNISAQAGGRQVQLQDNTENQGPGPGSRAQQEEEQEHQEPEGRSTEESTQSVQRVAPRAKRRSRRRRRRRSCRRGDKTVGVALKLVLKKSPEKGQQWVSQSSLPAAGGGELMGARLLPHTSELQPDLQGPDELSWTLQEPGATAAGPEQQHPPSGSRDVEEVEAQTPTVLPDSASALSPRIIQSSSSTEESTAPHSSFISPALITPQGKRVNYSFCSEVKPAQRLSHIISLELYASVSALRLPDNIDTRSSHEKFE